MKSERRHELQHNVLEDYVVKFGQRVQPYAKAITGGILAVIVLIGTYFYLNHRADVERTVAWERTFDALNAGDAKDLRSVVEAYPNTPAGLWAQLALADQELTTGVASLFTEKSVGKSNLHSALEDYQAVQLVASDPLMQQHALYGIGRAQESLGDLDKAKQAYERLKSGYDNGPYSERAKHALDNLGLDATKTFYDWFANVEPPPHSTGFDSGKRPFENLPLPADLKLPGTLGTKKAPPPEPKPDEGPAKTPAPSTTAPKSPDAKPGDTKANETKPADAKSSDTKPADAKSTPAKADTKPSDAKSPDTKPSDTKTIDTKSTDAKPDETKPADAKSTEAPKPTDTKSADGKPADDKSK